MGGRRQAGYAGWRGKKILERKLREIHFAFDPLLVSRTAGMIIFSSDDDFPNAQISAIKIKENISGITYHEFHEYGHFTNKLDFPELQSFPIPQ